MVVKLYKTDLSPPVRAAMMACDVFNVPVEMVEVNLLEKAHLSSDFIKKNPLHTVPVLEDGDLILHDSHAIMMYLADHYGKDESWYPKDTKQRALVNQKLFFDSSILFPRLRNVTFSMVLEGQKTIAQTLLDNIEEAYSFMEKFLSQTRYIAGDRITIADLSAISVVSSMVYILPANPQKYPKLLAWLNDVQQKPYCQKFNNPGASSLGKLIQDKRES